MCQLVSLKGSFFIQFFNQRVINWSEHHALDLCTRIWQLDQWSNDCTTVTVCVIVKFKLATKSIIPR